MLSGMTPGRTRAARRQTVTDMAKAKPKRGKAAIYARVSSKANEHGDSVTRQTAACRRASNQQKLTVACRVAEVISGSLKAECRPKFKQLLQKCSREGIGHLLVENPRAVARSSDAAERLYELSKELGVTITPADLPGLYKHEQNPSERFLRRIMHAYTELEKDLTVNRLSSGLKAKLSKAKAAKKRGDQVPVNQQGNVKVNGRRGILETSKLSSAKKKEFRRLCKDYSQGKVSSRALAVEMSRVLGRKKAISHETARRIAQASGTVP